MFGFFDNMPADCIKYILLKTTRQDQVRAAQLNKQFNTLANDPLLDLYKYKFLNVGFLLGDCLVKLTKIGKTAPYEYMIFLIEKGQIKKNFWITSSHAQSLLPLVAKGNIEDIIRLFRAWQDPLFRASATLLEEQLRRLESNIVACQEKDFKCENAIKPPSL